MKKIICLLVLVAQPALSNWSFNLGYQNPPGSSPVGANFLYFWSNWAFEVGIGSVTTTSTDASGNSSNRLGLGGDVDFKYLFKSGIFRPYLQAGLGAGVGAGSGGVSAGASGAFFGGGFFLKGSDVYAYLSYNIANSGFFQAGAGVEF